MRHEEPHPSRPPSRRLRMTGKVESNAMALARTRRGESGMNYWPGFVDALSTLILEHHLHSHRVRGGAVLSAAGSRRQRHRAAAASTRRSPSSPTCCRWRRPARPICRTSSRNCAPRSPPRESERDKYKGLADGAGAGAAAAQGKARELASQLEGEKKISANALAQVEMLNQQIAALRRQLAAIETALDASEAEGQGGAEPASPISASGSTWRWRRRCRS